MAPQSPKPQRVRTSAGYGDDDGAALRDVLFSWWEERFLAGSSGAPAISSTSDSP
jgi:hypothetical protein